MPLRITTNYALQTLCGDPHNVCNDEGKFNGMRPCRAVYDADHDLIDVVFGPFFICSCQNEDFSSLSESQLDYYAGLFRDPELFLCVDGKLKVIPYAL